MDVIQIDTIKSARGLEKCSLTFYFLGSVFFYAHLLYRRTPRAVKAVFNKLQKSLGKAHAFACLFPVILADRGVEFGNPGSLKASPERIRHTSIYYCDPGTAA